MRRSQQRSISGIGTSLREAPRTAREVDRMTGVAMQLPHLAYPAAIFNLSQRRQVIRMARVAPCVQRGVPRIIERSVLSCILTPLTLTCSHSLLDQKLTEAGRAASPTVPLGGVGAVNPCGILRNAINCCQIA